MPRQPAKAHPEGAAQRRGGGPNHGMYSQNATIQAKPQHIATQRDVYGPNTSCAAQTRQLGPDCDVYGPNVTIRAQPRRLRPNHGVRGPKPTIRAQRWRLSCVVQIRHVWPKRDDYGAITAIRAQPRCVGPSCNMCSPNASCGAVARAVDQPPPVSLPPHPTSLPHANYAPEWVFDAHTPSCSPHTTSSAPPHRSRPRKGGGGPPSFLLYPHTIGAKYGPATSTTPPLRRLCHLHVDYRFHFSSQSGILTSDFSGSRFCTCGRNRCSPG
jgi:hypothetical protein